MKFSTTRDRDANFETVWQSCIDGGGHPATFIEDHAYNMHEIIVALWEEEGHFSKQDLFEKLTEGFKLGLDKGMSLDPHGTVKMVHVSRNYAGDEGVFFFVGDDNTLLTKMFEKLGKYLNEIKTEEVVNE